VGSRLTSGGGRGWSASGDYRDHPPGSTCFTTTRTVYGIPTAMSNYASFLSSMNSAYSTAGVAWSGTRIPVYTTVATLASGAQATGYGYYDSNALALAGYSVVTSVVATTTCVPLSTSTPTLPPSPTGPDCTLHGDRCMCLSSYPLLGIHVSAAHES